MVMKLWCFLFLLGVSQQITSAKENDANHTQTRKNEGNIEESLLMIHKASPEEQKWQNPNSNYHYSIKYSEEGPDISKTDYISKEDNYHSFPGISACKCLTKILKKHGIPKKEFLIWLEEVIRKQKPTNKPDEIIYVIDPSWVIRHPDKWLAMLYEAGIPYEAVPNLAKYPYLSPTWILKNPNKWLLIIMENKKPDGSIDWIDIIVRNPEVIYEEENEEDPKHFLLLQNPIVSKLFNYILKVAKDSKEWQIIVDKLFSELERDNPVFEWIFTIPDIIKKVNSNLDNLLKYGNFDDNVIWDIISEKYPQITPNWIANHPEQWKEISETLNRIPDFLLHKLPNEILKLLIHKVDKILKPTNSLKFEIEWDIIFEKHPTLTSQWIINNSELWDRIEKVLNACLKKQFKEIFKVLLSKNPSILANLFSHLLHLPKNLIDITFDNTDLKEIFSTFLKNHPWIADWVVNNPSEWKILITNGNFHFSWSKLPEIIKLIIGKINDVTPENYPSIHHRNPFKIISKLLYIMGLKLKKLLDSNLLPENNIEWNMVFKKYPTVDPEWIVKNPEKWKIILESLRIKSEFLDGHRGFIPELLRNIYNQLEQLLKYSKVYAQNIDWNVVLEPYQHITAEWIISHPDEWKKISSKLDIPFAHTLGIFPTRIKNVRETIYTILKYILVPEHDNKWDIIFNKYPQITPGWILDNPHRWINIVKELILNVKMPYEETLFKILRLFNELLKRIRTSLLNVRTEKPDITKQLTWNKILEKYPYITANWISSHPNQWIELLKTLNLEINNPLTKGLNIVMDIISRIRENLNKKNIDISKFGEYFTKIITLLTADTPKNSPTLTPHQFPRILKWLKKYLYLLSESVRKWLKIANNNPIRIKNILDIFYQYRYFDKYFHFQNPTELFMKLIKRISVIFGKIPKGQREKIDWNLIIHRHPYINKEWIGNNLQEWNKIWNYYKLYHTIYNSEIPFLKPFLPLITTIYKNLYGVLNFDNPNKNEVFPSDTNPTKNPSLEIILNLIPDIRNLTEESVETNPNNDPTDFEFISIPYTTKNGKPINWNLLFKEHPYINSQWIKKNPEKWKEIIEDYPLDFEDNYPHKHTQDWWDILQNGLKNNSKLNVQIDWDLIFTEHPYITPEWILENPGKWHQILNEHHNPQDNSEPDFQTDWDLFFKKYPYITPEWILENPEKWHKILNKNHGLDWEFRYGFPWKYIAHWLKDIPKKVLSFLKHEVDHKNDGSYLGDQKPEWLKHIPMKWYYIIENILNSDKNSDWGSIFKPNLDWKENVTASETDNKYHWPNFESEPDVPQWLKDIPKKLNDTLMYKKDYLDELISKSKWVKDFPEKMPEVLNNPNEKDTEIDLEIMIQDNPDIRPQLIKNNPEEWLKIIKKYGWNRPHDIPEKLQGLQGASNPFWNKFPGPYVNNVLHQIKEDLDTTKTDVPENFPEFLNNPDEEDTEIDLEIMFENNPDITPQFIENNPEEWLKVIKKYGSKRPHKILEKLQGLHEVSKPFSNKFPIPYINNALYQTREDLDMLNADSPEKFPEVLNNPNEEDTELDLEIMVEDYPDITPQWIKNNPEEWLKRIKKYGSKRPHNILEKLHEASKPFSNKFSTLHLNHDTREDLDMLKADSPENYPELLNNPNEEDTEIDLEIMFENNPDMTPQWIKNHPEEWLSIIKKYGLKRPHKILEKLQGSHGTSHPFWNKISGPSSNNVLHQIREDPDTLKNTEDTSIDIKLDISKSLSDQDHTLNSSPKNHLTPSESEETSEDDSSKLQLNVPNWFKRRGKSPISMHNAQPSTEKSTERPLGENTHIKITRPNTKPKQIFNNTTKTKTQFAQNVPSKTQKNVPTKTRRNFPSKTRRNIPMKTRRNIPKKYFRRHLPKKYSHTFPQSVVQKTRNFKDIKENPIHDESLRNSYVPNMDFEVLFKHPNIQPKLLKKYLPTYEFDKSAKNNNLHDLDIEREITGDKKRQFPIKYVNSPQKWHRGLKRGNDPQFLIWQLLSDDESEKTTETNTSLIEPFIMGTDTTVAQTNKRKIQVNPNSIDSGDFYSSEDNTSLNPKGDIKMIKVEPYSKYDTKESVEQGLGSTDYQKYLGAILKKTAKGKKYSIKNSDNDVLSYPKKNKEKIQKKMIFPDASWGIENISTDQDTFPKWVKELVDYELHIDYQKGKNKNKDQRSTVKNQKGRYQVPKSDKSFTSDSETSVSSESEYNAQESRKLNIKKINSTKKADDSLFSLSNEAFEIKTMPKRSVDLEDSMTVPASNSGKGRLLPRTGKTRLTRIKDKTEEPSGVDAEIKEVKCNRKNNRVRRSCAP